MCIQHLQDQGRAMDLVIGDLSGLAVGRVTVAGPVLFI